MIRRLIANFTNHYMSTCPRIQDGRIGHELRLTIKFPNGRMLTTPSSRFAPGRTVADSVQYWLNQFKDGIGGDQLKGIHTTAGVQLYPDPAVQKQPVCEI